MRLQNKTVVITGGSGALGQVVVPVCVDAGARVIVVDRHSRATEAQGVRVMTADITNEADIRRLVEAILEEVGQIDVLINLVGGFELGRVIETCSR